MYVLIFSMIRCGVPQGSVLGPLLFIIYISITSVLNYVLFADDTNLFACHKNVDTLISILNKELDKVSNWLKVNKLSLNIKKTHFILFHNKQKLINTKINLKIDNSEIEQAFATKFLGVIINENLTWSDHVYVLLNKQVRILVSSANYLNHYRLILYILFTIHLGPIDPPLQY